MLIAREDKRKENFLGCNNHPSWLSTADLEAYVHLKERGGANMEHFLIYFFGPFLRKKQNVE
jgi:hypothetical protein